MNREKAIRLKFFELLTAANILYDDGVISIWDEKAEDQSNNLYILLQRQNAAAPTDFCSNKWTCRIDVRVVNKQRDTMSKDITDDIGEQVEDALSPLFSGAEYEGWQFLNIQMEDASYDPYDLTENDSVIEKLYTYRLTAIKL